MGRTLPELTGIFAYDHAGIEDLLEDLNQPKFRVSQIEKWLYQNHVESFDDMSDLPKSLREQLAKISPLHRAQIIETQTSKDGSKKYLIAYHDGTIVEAVALPSKDRTTVCLSTQAGCKMACAFCATGKGGFSRNLAPGEICEQIRLIGADLNKRITNVVMMGQGEPFLNFQSTIGAARFINSSNGFNVGARHIAISTCGIIPAIRKFSTIEEQFTLAISLHSAVQRVRDKLMPGCSSYTLDRLKDSLLSYVSATGRRPSLEYALIYKTNDSEEDLAALIDFCKKLHCHINLIRLNPISGCGFKPSTSERINYFAKSLNKVGIETSIRKSRAVDIQGACGQLIQNYKDS